MNLNFKLGYAVVDKMYQHLAGILIYLPHTKPNIAFVVSLLSQFMHSPREVHL